MTRFTRRQTLGLGIGAAALASPFGQAARAAVPTADATPPKIDIESGASLRVLRPAKFVPGDETAFNANTKAFTEATGVQVKVDYQAWEDLRPQTAVTANTGAGPDVVIGWTDDPHLYTDKLIELTDIAEYLGKKYGGWYPLAERLGKHFGTNNWIAIPLGGTGGAAVYRAGWVKEAGFDAFPKNTDDFLKMCQGLQKIGHPVGFTLGHAVGDANSFCHWLVWAFGGHMIDEAQKVTINSKQTIEALKYGKALYETFVPGTQSWLDPSNNKAMLAGEIAATQNGVSLYNSFKNAKDPNIAALAADVDNARMPVGPVGFGTETALVVNSMIFKHTAYPNAARAYLLYLMEVEQYDKWLTASLGYWAHPLKAYAKSDVWTIDPKVTVYRDTMQDSLWLAYKGPVSEKSAAVVADYVMVDMVAAACTGASTPEDAAAEAERRAKRYYQG
ncbi:ABC transporter substrate-binding protein [Labrys wisconsinensis]|uniref:Multiple sugar transport system substrate-binding protein n=1 Tax=Labrys wisconsinensis TaxID=425677 RepID=A0ABU0JIN6_9HYPH|nr:extracellular solute-binding protein [Labrys wisconsinensis]MDQ0474142.1 multiple sugar transport system substrate-binding protein [Labrys wisconsinensis]